MSSTMDPQIRALAAIKRQIKKIVSMGVTADDRLMIIDFGERTLAELKVRESEGTNK